MPSPEAIRYARQVLLPELGRAGQQRLLDARVLIVGLGGLGSPAAMYLAAAGVGTLGLVDFDVVDETNLHRQIIHGTADVGRSKMTSAVETLRAINPEVRLIQHEEPFGVSNARALVDAYDIVVDGTDNFPTRYLVNDACVMSGTPNVYGSIFRFEGQAAVFAVPAAFLPDGLRGPCYRCLHPEPPPPGLIPNCAEAGVLGVLPGIIGTIQATEAIKLITGIGNPLVGRLLLYDASRMTFRDITLSRDPECPVCGDAPTIRTLVAYDDTCAVQVAEVTEMAEGTEMKDVSRRSAEGAKADEMSVDELKQWRESGHAHMLLDVREPFEHASARIEGAVLIPMGIVMGQLDQLPKDRPIVVQCQSGGRSSRVTAALRQKGFDAVNLTGGIQAWRMAGHK
ncbi:MAG TPA: molybdopterin-synthase adenylyltransferase MoeB [Vicinamibacterales bacterium]|nr:molybdopterin-synthase adenylyltransferase MoeB [Vicinamibacterales bacterium]